MSSVANVVLVAGSPSENSRSSGVLGAVGQALGQRGLNTRTFQVRDFEPRDLVLSDTNARSVQLYVEAVKAAQALVVATPVYKGTYSGVLKLLLDVIPPDALVGKAVLGIATAKVEQHFESTERGFLDLYRFFQVRHSIAPLFLPDARVKLEAGQTLLDGHAQAELERAVTQLSAVLAPGQ